jgi:hypothetical protein
MDPVVAAFGTALVGAIATDAWGQVHEAVTGLWRRVHPRREGDGVGAELDELREQVLVARRDGDAGTERALEGPGSCGCSSCCSPTRPWPGSCGGCWTRC